MGDKDDAAKGQTGSVAPPPEQRSFSPRTGADDGYEPDTISRNDAEGATVLGEGMEAKGDVDAAAAKSDDGRFETDDFSRNDAEGGVALAEDADASQTSGMQSRSDAGRVRYNEDDPETRNAQNGPA